MAMTPEKLETIQAALSLQGEIKMLFVRSGLKEATSDEIASRVMDMVLKSEAVKPEIKAIYQELEDGIE